VALACGGETPPRQPPRTAALRAFRTRRYLAGATGSQFLERETTPDAEGGALLILTARAAPQIGAAPQDRS
jgi:hypothetical protein